jgi:hypothetical protein
MEEEIERAGSDENQDLGQVCHDDVIVTGIVEQAKQWCNEHGVFLSNRELKEAYGIFPKVCHQPLELMEVTIVLGCWISKKGP